MLVLLRSGRNARAKPQKLGSVMNQCLSRDGCMLGPLQQIDPIARCERMPRCFKE